MNEQKIKHLFLWICYENIIEILNKIKSANVRKIMSFEMKLQQQVYYCMQENKNEII